MFDIFEEKPQPKLYIADMVLEYSTKKITKKQVIRNKTLVKLNKQPVVLIDGALPTSNYQKRFFKKVFEKSGISGNFDLVEYRIVSITNMKLSSNLSYKFDYAIH